MQTQSLVLPKIPWSVPVAMVLAWLTTCALLLIMQDLIRVTDNVPDKADPFLITEYMRLLEEQPPVPVDPPEPPEKVATPPPVILDFTGPDAIGGQEIDFRPPVTAPAGPMRVAAPDGDALPFVKVSPVYPRSAIARGIEGYVVVSFDIDELGRVVDAVVIEAVPAGVFERSALAAIAKFRYKPRVVGGVPVRVEDVFHQLTYELAR